MGVTSTRRAVRRRLVALRGRPRTSRAYRRAHRRDKPDPNRSAHRRRLGVTRAVRRDRGAYALELRAARGHSRRAAEIPPNPARVDRVERDQLRAGTAAPRRASALRGPRRTVDRPRGYLSEVHAGPP